MQVYLVSGQIVNLLWQIFNAIGQIFMVVKARSDYTANLLRPAIDGCKIENFPIFRSDLQRPSPLRQSQRPATSVNEP